ncbi:39S ribosomal protein L49, mitochondrial [Acipenser oxyrinchus oxyrinchus]|uniref:Large ribosomal subunit protein mL49 n=1 Tax=Acipenser oxyrinchus oxyrinchus TaxID=40147 RepID=A0AAD8FX14_ACIOX|nr:39S ribosomal protein L49, mitochondrial [Acipenser oxyrinchus oxyrinchus]
MAGVGYLGLRNAIQCLKSARSTASLQHYSASAAAGPHYPGIVESTDEYRFVERLIPPPGFQSPQTPAVPRPAAGHPPQRSPSLPCAVRRSRMHNIPVYTDITHGNRKMTVIRKISGDIWALEQEVKSYLTQVTGKCPPTQVNEVTMSIRVKGYYDTELKAWLTEKGF